MRYMQQTIFRSPSYKVLKHEHDFKGPITWWISAPPPPPPWLKFCCHYVTSFSLGWNLKLRAKVRDCHPVSLKTQSLSMLKRTFQPGLNLNAITWCFPEFQPGLKFPARFPARAEIQLGLKVSPCNRKRLFKTICSGGRGEISARLTGLKFQPGLKFVM